MSPIQPGLSSSSASYSAEQPSAVPAITSTTEKVKNFFRKIADVISGALAGALMGILGGIMFVAYQDSKSGIATVDPKVALFCIGVFAVLGACINGYEAFKGNWR